MLEYVPQKEIVEKVCWFIRKYRPDAVFGMDPGSTWVKWHKTDHRASALLTVAGARAAAYHLYFPHHRIYEGLMPHTVRDWFFWSTREANYKIDITDVAELKFEAAPELMCAAESAPTRVSTATAPTVTGTSVLQRTDLEVAVPDRRTMIL
jgi:LmbE family N-acetylglucosaminyl deacetylase